MKIMKKRILAMVCTLILLGGTILQVMPKQIVDAADKTQAREWDIIKSTDTPLTVINTTEGSIVKAGSKSNCNINLPENISEGNLALYMKLNVDADESALELLNTAKNTYVELCNEKSDERERNWEIGSQYGLSNGENELMLRFDASGYHHGTDGKMPFDYRETINFFRLYTGNSNNSYTTDMRCKVEVTELRVVYTDAGLDFGQNGDDTYLQLSDELSENPTTIEASIKTNPMENGSTGWTLASLSEEEKRTLNNARFSLENTYSIHIPEKYITTSDKLSESKLAVTFRFYSSVATSLGDGQLELNSSGEQNDYSELRFLLKKSVAIKEGWNTIVLPLNLFTKDETASTVDIANLNYVRFYTGLLTGEFAIGDIRLIVLEKDADSLGTIGNAFSYDTVQIGTAQGRDGEPKQGTLYASIDLNDKMLNIENKFQLAIPEEYQSSQLSDLKNSPLAVAFWIYSSVDTSLGDGQLELTSEGKRTDTNEIRYMFRNMSDLKEGWNYIVLPFRLFEYNTDASIDLKNLNYLNFYTGKLTGTFATTDLELIVLEQDGDKEWTIGDAYILNSFKFKGTNYSFNNTFGKMGVSEGAEGEPAAGTIYSETTITKTGEQLKLFRFYDALNVGSYTVQDLALEFWVYSSTGAEPFARADNQVELQNQDGGNDSNEARWKFKEESLKVGWNHVILPLKEATIVGNFDISKAGKLRIYTTGTNQDSVLRFSDFKFIVQENTRAAQSDSSQNIEITAGTYKADSHYMIFSNTGNGNENQTALFVTNEGYPAYVEGDKQYTLEQNVCTGDWVDLAVVRDTNKIVFYIDGVQAGFCSASARTNTVPNTKHSIGADGIGEQVFNGSICDVRVWKDVRTANEIKDNLVDKSAVTLTSNNLDMTDSSLLGSWFLVGDIQYVLETMPDNAGGNHAVFCGSRANDWSDYQIPEELGKDYWSMVFIPDIQNLMTGKYTRLWYDMTDWIAANIEKENIKHVIGAGDSSWSNLSTEYRYAKNGFDKFTDSVSWSNMIGNHDYKWNQSKRDSSEYNNAFGKEYINSTYARFTYAGSMEDEYQVSGTENSYYTFTVNGVHWMILQLEYYPRQNVLTWADNVIKSHPNYNVILTTHSYLNGDGTYTNDYMDYTKSDESCGGALGETTEAIWNQIVAPNANVKMILCGHSTNGQGAVATKTLKNNAGNDVTALMMNVQDLDMNEGFIESAYYTGQGLGAVNILRFSADGSKVALQQYAPEYQKSFGTSSNAIQLDVQTQALDAVVEKCEKATAGVEPDKKPGYVFAGWFLDENCTKPLDAGQKEVEAYAKYVDEEIFSVKAQVSLLKDGETDLSRDIRFVTTVDSLQYSEVGFEITMKNKTKIVGNDEPYVYERLLALDDKNKVLTYEPNVAFSTKAAYFKAFTIRKIPYTAYESERITVRAYWKTFDGTEVYGKAVTKSIQDYLQLKNTGNLDKATLYGRSVIDSAGELNLFWTNSGLAFCFNGTGATAKMKSSSVTKNQAVTDNNCSYVEVYLDGASEVYQTICLNEDKEYVLAENLSEGEHKIELRKRNEAWGGNSLLVNIQSIDITGGKFLQQPAVAERNIEVIGDSITCGHGNLVTDGAGSFSTGTEDGTDTYAVIAGKKLGAEVSVIARSGIGYCRGTSTGSMYDYYTKTAALPNNVSDDSEWNFTENKKDVVVINLGTNDSNAKVAEEYMKTEAIAFLELVREKNPDATIIWAYGMMGSKGATSIQAAVEQRNQDGDKAVYYLSLTEMDTKTEGTGIGNHPTTASHQKNADVLAKFIAEKTGWQM